MSTRAVALDQLIDENATITSGDVSVSINTWAFDRLEIYGSCTTGAGSLTLQVSSDRSSWYDTTYQITTADASSFFGHFEICAPYYRIKYNQNMTGVDLWVAAKDL